jgi:hypothetical protein
MDFRIFDNEVEAKSWENFLFFKCYDPLLIYSIIHIYKRSYLFSFFSIAISAKLVKVEGSHAANSDKTFRLI